MKKTNRSLARTLLLIPGDQLFSPQEHVFPKLPKSQITVAFMAEHESLCTHFRYHKKKIVFFLSAMRAHAETLRATGIEVAYHPLAEEKEASHPSYFELLEKVITRYGIQRVVSFEIEDRFFESELRAFFHERQLEWDELPSPMFFTTREEFKSYLKTQKKPFMKTFYERQRKRLKILVTEHGDPVGGQWSFDAENRKRLPDGIRAPLLPELKHSVTRSEVENLVTRRFNNHPGTAENLWCPTTREEALSWLQSFLKERFENFGEYEDAFSRDQDFLFHAAITPLLNSGLLTPSEVVQSALEHAKKAKTPMNSLEGFIRQVIGWREFIRGIYRNFDDQQVTRNFWNHTRLMAPSWTDGTTGLPPLDETIQKCVRLGYAHHIERLMVLANTMLLSELHPSQAHRWFMEHFIDSADWVMGPNVFGMGLFSDGGVFATKPYICGSNYWLKMGHWKKGSWCDVADGLYWRFIEKNHDFFSKNPRLSMMARTLEKMPDSKKRVIFDAAEEFIQRNTLLPKAANKHNLK